MAIIDGIRRWFAKCFLHPDIVAEYEYILLWDEDVGVEDFHPGRYISIVKDEGLEISQPALDLRKSEVHHPITVRRRKSRVHRKYYKFKGSGRCDGNSISPACVGWVEMMAPMFSRVAGRCACGSKAEHLPLVVRCRERRDLIRAAANHRYVLAFAYFSYFRSLKDVGDALWKFVDEELITA
ncbi:hypothetical protein PHJA_002025000 [Phtheirospermum japonicum]|uniref:DUF630 domain-containing protein n=1 Tax=Phtheirospermum japonicum TaxID=374723 RepID=A0A830CX74_9LAMI|nr:hypothetical protein PHJA_002025000 [Phtheirospermum japonicum]